MGNVHVSVSVGNKRRACLWVETDRMDWLNTKHIHHGHLGECTMALWEMYSGESSLLGYRFCLSNNMTHRRENEETTERERDSERGKMREKDMKGTATSQINLSRKAEELRNIITLAAHRYIYKVFLLSPLWTVKIYTPETHFSHCNTEFYDFCLECHEQILFPAPQITSGGNYTFG